MTITLPHHTTSTPIFDALRAAHTDDLDFHFATLPVDVTSHTRPHHDAAGGVVIVDADIITTVDRPAPAPAEDYDTDIELLAHEPITLDAVLWAIALGFAIGTIVWLYFTIGVA